jgi:hypothetical protein
VSIAGGGLTMYDSYSILRSSKLTPKIYRELYGYIVDNYDAGTYISPESDDLDKYGNYIPYITGILKIRPFDYYKDINIPMLFVHGENDYNMAVESTKYVQTYLPQKPFDFIYYRLPVGVPISVYPYH